MTEKTIIGYLDEAGNKYMYRKAGETQEEYLSRMGNLRDEILPRLTDEDKCVILDTLKAMNLPAII